MPATKNQHALITGGTGFIGTALAKTMLKQGWLVTVLTRSANAADNNSSNGIRYINQLPDVAAGEPWLFNIVVNLAGENLFDRRWNASVKSDLVASRVSTTQKLIDAFAAGARPEVFISGSAIGYYGTATDQVATEQDPAGTDFASQLCQQWETTALQARQFGIRCNIIRIAVVMGNGGALANMLTPFKLGLGGRMGSGEQWFSWIAMEDLLRLILHIIADPHLNTTLNASSPTPVTNANFTKALGKALHRPTVIPMPAAAVKLLFGEVSSLLLQGRPVLPARAGAAGFQFKHENLTEYLDQLFGHLSA